MRAHGVLQQDRATERPPSQRAARQVKTGAGIALGGGGGYQDTGDSGPLPSRTLYLSMRLVGVLVVTPSLRVPLQSKPAHYKVTCPLLLFIDMCSWECEDAETCYCTGISPLQTGIEFRICGKSVHSWRTHILTSHSRLVMSYSCLGYLARSGAAVSQHGQRSKALPCSLIKEHGSVGMRSMSNSG